MNILYNKRAKISMVVIVIIVAIFGIVVAAIGAGFGITFDNKNVSDNDKSDIRTSSPTKIRTTVTQQKTDLPSSTPIPTSTPTVVDTETPTRSQSKTRDNNTESDTATKNSAIYREALYDNYMSIYNTSLDNSSVNVYKYTVDPENESATIYWTQNPSNWTSHIENRQSALANYAVTADTIRESKNLTTKAVPKRMYFSIHSPDGKLYMITYIDYLAAFRYSEGTMSVFDYQGEYEANAKYGPAHPRYEENQTATAASA